MLSQLGSFFDVCAVYYTTQLVRCIMFSYMVLGIVMLLRKLLFPKLTFVKGTLWGLFLILPFLGRLKIFYENPVVLKWTWRMTMVTMRYYLLDYIYMAGILIAAILIFGKRLRLQRAVSRMKSVLIGEHQITVTDMNVTPFTTGLLKPRIVLPRIMLEAYNEEELEVILQHEQTHIRLGHLWCYLAWDVLRCLLWLNPLLSLCQKQFRADLEDMCDRVCIQNSNNTAQEYGQVLLKSLKLLRSEEGAVSSVATYAGERQYKDMKRRIKTIAAFQPYRQRVFAGMMVLVAGLLCSLLFGIHCCSYPRCSELDNILVYQYEKEQGTLLPDEENRLQQMIHYDDHYVYVKREEFEDFLRKHDAQGEINIVFGGFQKLPGMGGNANSCVYEADTREDVVRIPYERRRDSLRVILFKLM